MNDQSFTTTFTVDQTPEQAFAAITNVRGWWSENIQGDTDRLGAVFDYRYQDIHRCKLHIVEFVPGKRVAWHVVENYFSFTDDKTEWTGTKIVFDISRDGGKTKVQFTHQGLVPEYECYDACSDGWGTYINSSLRDLIAIGKGQPNVGEPITGSERTLTTGNDSYTATFTVDQSPDEVFAGISDVRAWWTGETDGDSQKLGDEFTYRYEDIHQSTQKVTALVPGKKIVWHVTDAQLSFVGDKAEWKGTDIIFDIARNGDKTEVRFTHLGLVPDFECFEGCSAGWNFYINGSLKNLLSASKVAA